MRRAGRVGRRVLQRGRRSRLPCGRLLRVLTVSSTEADGRWSAADQSGHIGGQETSTGGGTRALNRAGMRHIDWRAGRESADARRVTGKDDEEAEAEGAVKGPAPIGRAPKIGDREVDRRARRFPTSASPSGTGFDAGTYPRFGSYFHLVSTTLSFTLQTPLFFAT